MLHFAGGGVPDGYQLQESPEGVQPVLPGVVGPGVDCVAPPAGGVRGLVEELLVQDDPEHEWIDRLGLRTPRASNEARQRLFLKLSGRVQRQLGRKALDSCANAVLGYTLLLTLHSH